MLWSFWVIFFNLVCGFYFVGVFVIVVVVFVAAPNEPNEANSETHL